MRRPRPVTLTGAERRALRAIEEALTADDPGLSLLLRGLAEPNRPGGRVRRTTWIYATVSVVVLVFGLVVADTALLGLGIVMLMLTPAVLACAAEVVRRWP
jgi:hypothetical protein